MNSEITAPGAAAAIPLRERVFVPTERVLLFGEAGRAVEYGGGGTAGRRGRRPIDRDGIEILAMARKGTGTR